MEKEGYQNVCAVVEVKNLDNLIGNLDAIREESTKDEAGTQEGRRATGMISSFFQTLNDIARSKRDIKTARRKLITIWEEQRGLLACINTSGRDCCHYSLDLIVISNSNRVIIQP